LHDARGHARVGELNRKAGQGGAIAIKHVDRAIHGGDDDVELFVAIDIRKDGRGVDAESTTRSMVAVARLRSISIGKPARIAPLRSMA